jgi:cbb3-type cytochrome oxidase subunit 3
MKIDFAYMAQASYLWLSLALIVFIIIVIWLFVFSRKEDFEKQEKLVYNDADNSDSTKVLNGRPTKKRSQN